MAEANVSGWRLLSGYLSRPQQNQLVRELAAVMAEAPLFVPRMPRTGRPFSVRMTNCGPLGWVSDKVKGYRYEPCHPETGRPWPPMPPLLEEIWADLAAYPAPPEACLVNYYGPKAKMGLHQDRDEADFSAPLISISLGDTGIYRLGGVTRRAPTRSFPLHSGDVLVLGGAARLAYHGIDRILPGSSDLLPEGGRINLTLRRVTKP